MDSASSADVVQMQVEEAPETFAASGARLGEVGDEPMELKPRSERRPFESPL